MTQEEKAKRYDEAIKVAQRFYNNSVAVTKKGLEHVFPKLKENEDEKIRKALVELVHDTTGDSLWIDYDVHKEDAIAWLEKQGEKGTKGSEREIPNSEPPLTLKHAKEVMGIKQDDAWSEEDEKIKCSLVYLIEEIIRQPLKRREDWKGYIAWLKSLKGRVQPQPKQEWSEEDEKNLDWLITVCERIHYKSDPQVSTESALMLRDWLKSLKERYTWKPSDEQMKGIECTIKTLRYQLNAGDNRLDSLYNDLKKLRGE